MDLSIIQFGFFVYSLGTLFCGLLINIAEPYLPVIITRTYRYGKYAAKGESFIAAKTEIPKRWYKHFYELAAPLSIYILYLVLQVYFLNGTTPQLVLYILDVLFGPNRRPLVIPPVSAEHVTLAAVLFSIQCCKRFYESHFVSIFGDGKMNIWHYLAGYMHYVGSLLCVIAESQGFVRGYQQNINFNKLTYLNYACVVIFLWATYAQLCTNLILVNLRKNKKGDVVTLRHGLPQGGLFNYISAPLQFTEILMYSSLAMILKDSTTFPFILFWVLVNQVECACLNHWWYIENFKDFPPQRKALIPKIW